jgi:epsilon-lactone hydrolase
MVSHHLTAGGRVDNFQVSYDGYLKDAAILYANGRDLKEPMLSPLYGDLHGFPPTILTPARAICS